METIESVYDLLSFELLVSFFDLKRSFFKFRLFFAHYRHEIKTNEMVVIFASRCQYGRYFQFPIASSSRNVSVRLLVPELLKIKINGCHGDVATRLQGREVRDGTWYVCGYYIVDHVCGGVGTANRPRGE